MFKYNHRVLRSSLLVFVAWLAVNEQFICIEAIKSPTSGIAKIVAETSPKELKMNIKVYLTKWNLRRVPLAKERNEILLSKLYYEERLVMEQEAELERNLLMISDNTRRLGIKVIEVQRNPDTNKGFEGSGLGRNLMKVSELTQAKIDGWKKELEAKKKELVMLRARIEEAKNIIRKPESYISVPSNYGQIEPEVVRQREREILVKDRHNMNYRASVESGAEPPPLWLTDEW